MTEAKATAATRLKVEIFHPHILVNIEMPSKWHIWQEYVWYTLQFNQHTQGDISFWLINWKQSRSILLQTNSTLQVIKKFHKHLHCHFMDRSALLDRKIRKYSILYWNFVLKSVFIGDLSLITLIFHTLKEFHFFSIFWERLVLITCFSCCKREYYSFKICKLCLKLL